MPRKKLIIDSSNDEDVDKREKENDEKSEAESTNISTSDADKEPKKKPGRPKKQVHKKPIEKLGIVNEPSNIKTADPRKINIFEIFYDNPMMFKKIFNLFKSMSSEFIRFRIEKEEFKMFSFDHDKHNQIYIRIFGSRMNRYYFSKVLEFGISSNNIQKILQTLNKDCSKICWYTNQQYERSKIHISLFNDEMCELSVYSVDLNQIDDYDWDVEREIKLEKDYPLSFDLPFKYFKKKINDFKSLGDIMKIEKHGEKNLNINTFSDNKGCQNTFFHNSEKIHLHSEVKPDEIFSTSVFIEHLIPLSSSLISDFIHIAVCINQKIIFTAYLDQDERPNKDKILGTEKCEIKILTDIVKVQPKTE